MWKRSFCARHLQKVKLTMWKPSFRARPPSKSESSRCENKAFVRDLLQKVSVEDVKTKLSCETSFKDWKCKMWQKSSCETSFKKWKWKMWKQSLRARLLSNFESWRCKNEAFVRGVLQTWKVQMVKTKPELSVPLRGRSENDPGLNESVPQPPAGQASPSIFRDTFCPAKHSISCSRYLSKTHFAGDILQKVKVQDVKTKLSCETSFKKWKCKMWKRSFRARPPWKKWKFKMWK